MASSQVSSYVSKIKNMCRGKDGNELRQHLLYEIPDLDVTWMTVEDAREIKDKLRRDGYDIAAEIFSRLMNM